MELLQDFQAVIFIDASINMVEKVKEKIEKLDIQNAKTLYYDIEKVETDIKADYIIMAQVLIHIENTEMILSRLYKMLNNEGHLIIVDFNKTDSINSEEVHNGFNKEELKELLLKIGYKESVGETFYSERNMFMGEDASLFILDCKK